MRSEGSTGDVVASPDPQKNKLMLYEDEDRMLHYQLTDECVNRRCRNRIEKDVWHSLCDYHVEKARKWNYRNGVTHPINE